FAQGLGFFGRARHFRAGLGHSRLNANRNFVKVPALGAERLCDPRRHLAQLGRMGGTGHRQRQALAFQFGHHAHDAQRRRQHGGHGLLYLQMRACRSQYAGGARIVTQPPQGGVAFPPAGGRTCAVWNGSVHAGSNNRIRTLKIVIMHARDGQPGQFALGGAQLVLVLAALLATAALIGATVQRYLTPVAPAAYSVDWAAYAQDAQPGREAAFLRENVSMLAAKVGELQGKLVGIDSLGRRVAQVAGVAYTDPELAAELNAPAHAEHVMDDLFTDRQPPGYESAKEL